MNEPRRSAQDGPVPLAQRLARAGEPVEAPGWLARPVTPRARRLAPLSENLTPVAAIADAPGRAAALAEERSAARREAAEAVRAEHDAVVRRFAVSLAELAATVRAARCPDAGEIVELAMLVAGELCGRELAVDKDGLARRLAAVLVDVTHTGDVVVRLHPADLAEVRRLRPDLEGHGVTFAEAATVAPGGFVVETPQAVIDATVGRRLEAARAAVAGLVADALRAEERRP